MNYDPIEPVAAISRFGNITRIEDARIEEVSCPFSPESILISYPITQAAQETQRQRLQLNVNRNTVILNPFGQSVSICSLRPGMLVNAVVSSGMTRSIPPQTSAFVIVVQGGFRPYASMVTVSRILYYDPVNRLLYTGRPGDSSSQMVFAVTNATSIIDRSGRPGNVSLLRPGQQVRVTHADFQTASIPPQTTAFRIRLL
ncbi:MAG: hypothetical protein MR868_05955 [Lachnospiraceae bacterium]|nr:hypothetical protein [Lachnospiraceae bacterium]